MKYTVITGASSGIGYETALAFAEKGKNLIVVARRDNRLEELKSKISVINPKLDVVIKKSDLSKSEEAYKLYDSLKDYDIETWINNAGIGEYSPSVIEQNLNNVEMLIQINIKTLTILSTLYARDYVNREGSQLINVSSGLGYMVAIGNVAYSASKYYVGAFTEGLAEEMRQSNAKLKVKILAPAITETEILNPGGKEQVDLKTIVSKFHTAKEMADFMILLYDSNEVVGIVDEKTYEFQLRKPINPILNT